MGRIQDMVRMGLHMSQAQAIGHPNNGTCTLAAAGNSWATATPITAGVAFVTSAQDGTKGVALPAAFEVGDRWFITTTDDSSTDACILYPPASTAINCAANDATYSITDVKTVMVVAVSTTKFICLGM